jgi:hypothetical protein
MSVCHDLHTEERATVKIQGVSDSVAGAIA